MGISDSLTYIVRDFTPAQIAFLVFSSNFFLFIILKAIDYVNDHLRPINPRDYLDKNLHRKVWYIIPNTTMRVDGFLEGIEYAKGSPPKGWKQDYEVIIRRGRGKDPLPLSAQGKQWDFKT